VGDQVEFEFAVVVGAGAFLDAGHGVDELAGEVGEQDRFALGFVVLVGLHPSVAGDPCLGPALAADPVLGPVVAGGLDVELEGVGVGVGVEGFGLGCARAGAAEPPFHPVAGTPVGRRALVDGCHAWTIAWVRAEAKGIGEGSRRSFRRPEGVSGPSVDHR
jgi:hypothetical protein